MWDSIDGGSVDEPIAEPDQHNGDHRHQTDRASHGPSPPWPVDRDDEGERDWRQDDRVLSHEERDPEYARQPDQSAVRGLLPVPVSHEHESGQHAREAHVDGAEVRQSDDVGRRQPEAGHHQPPRPAHQPGANGIEEHAGRCSREQRDDAEPEQDLTECARVVVGRDDVVRVIEPVTTPIGSGLGKNGVGDCHWQQCWKHMVEQAVLGIHPQIVFVHGDETSGEVHGFVDRRCVSRCLDEPDEDEPDNEHRQHRQGRAHAHVRSTICSWVHAIDLQPA